MKSLLFVAGATLAVCAGGFSQDRADRAPERLSGRYMTRPSTFKPEAVGHAAVPTIPLWSATVSGYTYQMVGQSPFTALANPTTTITTPVIPLVLTFSDGTVLDPTAANTGCSKSSPLSLMLSSPIFNNSTYTVGGVTVGNTTYHDFFQRANFWQYAQPGGVNPNYHTLLSGAAGAAVKITVPSASGKSLTSSCGSRGEVDVNFLDNYLLNTVFKQLATAGVTPSQFPVFVLDNVVMYDATASNCCILGYHSAFNNSSYSNALQTYAVADFDTTGLFGSSSDTAPFSHEIGEWMDDPTGGNPTPAWGNVGQVSGCQANLEVGDPLSGNDITVTMSNAYTYHLQELAFVSWFYRQAPSTGVNGWYSSNGTFKTPAGPCDSTTTTLTISPSNMAVGATATVTATVKPTVSGVGAPTGTVTLTSGATGNTLATYTLNGTTAGGTITTLPAGSYSVTAKYSGDETFSASTSAPVSISVGTSAVTFTPISLTFPSQSVGSAGAAQTVTMKNGGAAPLTGLAVSLAGASPGDFSQSNTCGVTLAAGAGCTLSVTFKPTASGTRTATLSVAGSGAGSPWTVALSGTATGSAGVTLTPSSLSFGNVNVGSSGATQTVTLKNSGTSALSISSMYLSGADPSDFPGTTSCTATVAAGASCSIAITFKPTVTGSLTASVVVVDNASGSPQTVSLSGTGIPVPAPKITLSATSLVFGSVTAGSSASQSLTVTNSGTAALSLSLPFAVTGAAFTDTTACAASLAPNAGCTVTVTFKPSAKIAYSGALSITSNAASSPLKVTFTGAGK